MFPVHRSLRFLLLSATAGGRTAALPCRFGIRRPEVLERLPEIGPDPQAVMLTRALLEQLTGDEIAVPDIRSARDVDILHAIAFTVPTLGDPAGWHIHFGRELNATDDRRHFLAGGDGLPVVEGKHLAPFRVDVARTRLRIAPEVAARLLDPARTFARSRLGYREVASATNRLTLIAAVVPAGTVTTHTVFCLKDQVDDECQVVPVRHAQQLRRELPRAVARQHARLLRHHRSAAGTVTSPGRAALPRDRRAQPIARRGTTRSA